MELPKGYLLYDASLGAAADRVVKSASNALVERGVALVDYFIVIKEREVGNDDPWEVWFVPHNFLHQRGGDYLVQVDSRNESVQKVLMGQ